MQLSGAGAALMQQWHHDVAAGRREFNPKGHKRKGSASHGVV